MSYSMFVCFLFIHINIHKLNMYEDNILNTILLSRYKYDKYMLK